MIYHSLFIDKWLQHIPRRHFRFYLLTFKDVVSHILRHSNASTEYQKVMQLAGKRMVLDFMGKLYKVRYTCTFYCVGFLLNKTGVISTCI